MEKENGKKIIIASFVIGILENIKMILNMDKVNFFGKVVTYIKVLMKMIKDMVMEN